MACRVAQQAASPKGATSAFWDWQTCCDSTQLYAAFVAQLSRSLRLVYIEVTADTSMVLRGWKCFHCKARGHATGTPLTPLPLARRHRHGVRLHNAGKNVGKPRFALTSSLSFERSAKPLNEVHT